jgi:hypothetical protein
MPIYLCAVSRTNSRGEPDRKYLADNKTPYGELVLVKNHSPQGRLIWVNLRS